ncbi:hypothetical protein F0P96_18990 [Hymenobacter busanensis]|uniref:Uncharacterized protein n=1 Tax=Hymenobacter busanensis TaxID=2607656 RepID=A0A7L4ZU19_9BACT|nr:DUF5995 family protein [Hymenobacter busanensis]KAA9325854.1 hypothetical protein F0P96_18990 [Hymenobacter busanensis]QHJ06306.1 hypothetical protein GUY19_02935 [Hymenobacter busanensis]
MAQISPHPAPRTISEVVTALAAIVRQCEQTRHRAGYFAALYRRMTVAVAEGIRAGAFDDGPRMERLDLVFAGRYLSAWQAYGQQAACTASWKYAFDGCRAQPLIVLQQLLLGINTHINLDLAIAAATVAPGPRIHALEADFNRINAVISSLFDDVQQCLEQVWFPMRWLRRVAATQQTDVLNFSIGAARKTAWANAVLLAQMSPAQQQAHIVAMDAAVLNVARRISNPGPWSAALLRLIRATEYDDVARTIRLIDTTQVG